MTQPTGPILGAVHLDDGNSTRFRWNEEIGIASPATRATGSIQSTFGGPVRVLPSGVIYPPKDLDLPGYLLQVNGLAEGYDRLDRLYDLAGTAGTLSILQVGGLGLSVIPEAPVVERLKAHRVQLDFSMKGTAVPATWTTLFGVSSGAAYGNIFNGESLINTGAFTLSSGASPAVTNAGTAATPLVLTVSVLGRTTRFYVRSTAPGYTKRISVTPINGVVFIGEKDGLFVPPGTSVLRYEEAAGTLITGTIASSIYGTRWRYEGLDDTLSEAEPVILYNTRQQRAYAATSAFTTLAGLTLYGPDVPRFGNSGTFDAVDAGLVVEPDRTNLVLQSQALGTTWTQAGTIAVTNNNSTAPDGTTTSTKVQLTGGSPGSVSQNITLTAAPYVISFYVRGTGSFKVSMGTVLLPAQVVIPGTNWARYQFLVTGTAAAHSLKFEDNSTAAAELQLWGVQVELASGQTATNATSYIPTTSTTQRRYADVVGVRRLENLLAYSNRFDKSTLVATTRGLWHVAGGTVNTATLQPGPSGVTNAATMTAVGAVAGIQQRIVNAEDLAGKTVQFSVWVKNNVATPDSDVLLSIQEFGTVAGTTTGNPANVIDQWTRISVQRKLSTGVTDVSVQIGSSGTITYLFAHAQVVVASEGAHNLASGHTAAVSAPYIETQATPYQSQGTWTWPSWLNQNGYIEADVCLSETANPNLQTRIILGQQGAATAPSMESGVVFRSSGTGSASHTINAMKTDNLGSPVLTYTPGTSLYDGAYHKYRVEWRNYLVAGVRNMDLRFYVDGAIVASTTRPTSVSWLTPSNLFAVHPGGAQSFQTMKNIKIGSPTLPAGAIPEPY